MPFNSITSRSDAGALIPEEVSKEMLRVATGQSAALTQFRRIPVSRKQVRFPVLSALPVAYFVNGDTGLKQTTQMQWANKYVNMEEIAVILPIPDSVIADVDANIWDEAMPFCTEAIGRCLDDAAFFGTGAPSTWPTYISSAANSSGNTLIADAAATAGAGFGDLDEAYGFLDSDGFDATGIVANTLWRARIRNSRASDGQKLDAGRASADLKTIDGMPVSYPMRGLWPSTSGGVYAFVGDWTQFVIGVRQDITMKILTEAVIQDNTGAIIYNLAQQDMTAVRLVMRMGWQVANLINHDQPVEANRYPVCRITIA